MDIPTLGAAIKAYFHSEKSYKLIDAYRSTAGSTWVAGGCWAAAKALHSLLSGSRLVAMVGFRGRGRPEHVVVEYRGWYLDADGASSHRELIRRWREQELVENPRIMPFQPEMAGGMVCPSGLVRDLREELRPIVTSFLKGF